jgi:hypothetical protein
VYDFLDIPDLNEQECREMVALEKDIENLEVDLTNDANIRALEKRYEAFSNGQKESMLNYDKLVQARAQYNAAHSLCGDLNMDSTVNQQDITKLKRHLAGWNEDFAEELADVNSDGMVNVLDLTILCRHVAGWTEYETLPYTPAAKGGA